MVKKNVLSINQRKTPRLLALEAAKKVKKEQQENSSNIVPTRRTLKMKRLDEIVPTFLGPKSEQEEGMIKHEAPRFGQAIVPRDQKIPSKEILEFVIDTLQRKDKYRYFAEPVNGDEVEDYYDFIKEPMDFGTMRGKLDQGLYTTLKQFQDDVYLICQNAMSFNASSTIFYRKARAIKELADIVFNTLETNPANIILKFSKRKLSGQIPKDEAETSDAQHDKIKRKRSVRRRPTVWKNSAINKEELRHTYRHPTSREETYFSSGKQLVLAGDKESQGLGYKESLMRFVKDLGPVAQQVAKKKIVPLHQPQSHSLIVPSQHERGEYVNSKYNFTSNPSHPQTIHKADHLRQGNKVPGAYSFNHCQRETNYLAMMDSARIDASTQKCKMGVRAHSFAHPQNETSYLALMTSAITDPNAQKGKMAVEADYSDRYQTETNHFPLMSSTRRDIDPYQKGKMVLGSDTFGQYPQTNANILPMNSNAPSFAGSKSIVYPSRVVPEYNLSLSGNMFKPSYNFSQMQQQLINPIHNQFPGLQHIGRYQDLGHHLQMTDPKL